jgi:hypothetical protein
MTEAFPYLVGVTTNVGAKMIGVIHNHLALVGGRRLADIAFVSSPWVR